MSRSYILRSLSKLHCRFRLQLVCNAVRRCSMRQGTGCTAVEVAVVRLMTRQPTRRTDLRHRGPLLVFRSSRVRFRPVRRKFPWMMCGCVSSVYIELLPEVTVSFRPPRTRLHLENMIASRRRPIPNDGRLPLRTTPPTIFYYYDNDDGTTEWGRPYLMTRPRNRMHCHIF